jgi:hypothetical protein
MYLTPALDAQITQGDIIDDCPILAWTRPKNGDSSEWELRQSRERVIVLTQACDLANAKTTNVQVAIVHLANQLVESGILKASTIKEQVRYHRVFGVYFLPEHTASSLPESVIDLRDIHTVPKELLENLCRLQKRLVRLDTPYREHLAQHFAVTFSRIALPEPYETK